MKESKHRGNYIELNNDIWYYFDTKESVLLNPDRSCGHCNRENTVEGHDACLGTLPGVLNACCGHGNIELSYIQFENGERIGGINVLLYIHSENIKIYESLI